MGDKKLRPRSYDSCILVWVSKSFWNLALLISVVFFSLGQILGHYFQLPHDTLLLQHFLFIFVTIPLSDAILFFFYWRYNPLWVCISQPSSGAMASSRTRFLDHSQRRATVGRTPLDEWSVRRRDLYLTTHNTYNRQISMPPVGFEPTIAAGKRP